MEKEYHSCIMGLKVCTRLVMVYFFYAFEYKVILPCRDIWCFFPEVQKLKNIEKSGKEREKREYFSYTRALPFSFNKLLLIIKRKRKARYYQEERTHTKLVFLIHHYIIYIKLEEDNYINTLINKIWNNMLCQRSPSS